ncbi:MAG: NAD-dependent epimerase/dehydratase family protein [Gammaproteobacteria bacterium]|nr:NAD-dependent epimerase/dehydratase family protein [Gammaproteobacteria bacterium]
MKTETILVVGASGFIGAAVTRALVAAGFAVRALDPFQRDDLPDGITWFQGTTGDGDLVTRAITGCDRVVFLGGNSAPDAGIPTVAREITGEVLPVIDFAEACATAGCAQFIFASSAGTVYGPSAAQQIAEDHPLAPIAPYGASKVSTEVYLRILARKYPMKSLILRLSNPYGPGQVVKRNQGFVAAAMAAAVEGRTLPIWGDGSVTRDYIYIDDVARAFAAACASEPMSDTINIGSGLGVTLLELRAAIEVATDRELAVNFEPARTVDIPRNVIDRTRAAARLGWQPEIDLSDGLRQTARWWDA